MITTWATIYHMANGESVVIKNKPINVPRLGQLMRLEEVGIHDAKYPAQVIPVIATILNGASGIDWEIQFDRDGYSWRIIVKVHVGDSTITRMTRDLDSLTQDEIKIELMVLLSTIENKIMMELGKDLGLWELMLPQIPKIHKCPMEAFNVL